jgi:PhzF family phenazine biosynthesis protein
MRIGIIDAFTDRPFAGNPAGVCLLDTGTWADEVWMRQVAAELSHETAFARPPAGGRCADWALRWFTPAAESNVCGHATLATAHALHTDRAMPLTVRFTSSFGLLTLRTRLDGTITLDFPAASPAETPAPDGLTQALGARPHATYRTGALGDLLATVGDEAAVRSLQPDFTALARLTHRNSIRGIIVTAAAADLHSGYDFVSRYFASTRARKTAGSPSSAPPR